MDAHFWLSRWQWHLAAEIESFSRIVKFGSVVGE